jgi:hypothetical protein
MSEPSFGPVGEVNGARLIGTARRAAEPLLRMPELVGLR